MTTYSKVASQLNKELHAFVRDTEDLLEATRDLAGDQIDEIRSRANKSLKSLRKGLRDLPGEITDQLEDVGEAAGKAIRRKPLQWVGIAAGIGLVVGILAMSRSRD
jgi:ElaB/YqjD/DUF883 family membrane-anchored ribosome-binding protein